MLGVEERSLGRRNSRKLLPRQHFRNTSLIDAEKGSNLMIEKFLCRLQIANFSRHFRGDGWRMLPFHFALPLSQRGQ